MLQQMRIAVFALTNDHVMWQLQSKVLKERIRSRLHGGVNHHQQVLLQISRGAFLNLYHVIMQLYINLCIGTAPKEPNTLSYLGLLDRILLRPFPGGGLVLLSVQLVYVCNFRHQRIVWVGIGQQGADRQKHLRDGERGRPLVFQDI